MTDPGFTEHARWLRVVDRLLGNGTYDEQVEARKTMWIEVYRHIVRFARFWIDPLADEVDIRRDVAAEVMRRLEQDSFRHIRSWREKQLRVLERLSRSMFMFPVRISTWWGWIDSMARESAFDLVRRQSLAPRGKPYQQPQVFPVDPAVLDRGLRRGSIPSDVRPMREYTPARKPSRAKTPPRAYDVMLSATHPRSIGPREWFRIDIVIHIRAAGPRASALMAVAPNLAVVRLRRGAQLQIAVRPPPGIKAPESVRNVIWKPPRSSVSFFLNSAARAKSGIYVLTFAISTTGSYGVEITHFDVPIKINRMASTTSRMTRKPIRRLPATYFASYARLDWEEVKGRVSTIEAIGGDVFVDCLDIGEGMRWETEIRDQVEKRDGFLLFWSRAARNSKWVRREWRHRLRKRGLNSITPNALEAPALCPPPKSLARLQFGSRYLEFARRK